MAKTEPKTTGLGDHWGRNEDLRVSPKAGKPPRPATEPVGAEGSSHSKKTMTDPATGEPKTAQGTIAK